MFIFQAYIRKMSFIALLSAFVVYAGPGKENPSGLLGKLPLNGNLAWERYKIEGFAWPNSVKPGETIKFYVSVQNQGGQNYQIQIFRIPQQEEVDVLWTSNTIAGNFYPMRDQSGNPINPGDHSRNPVDFKIGCKSYWEPGAIAFTIPSNWQSGMYYARLNHLALPAGDSEKYYYLPFVVRATSAGSTSKILFKFEFNTFQAYNYWGGGSLYSYPQDALTLTPTDTIAMDRPIRKDFSDAVTYFLTPFAKTLEDSGYVMEYCNNIDLDSTSAPSEEFGINLLNKYKMLVIWDHDEYWSTDERRNTESFKGQTHQGNIARFAPNTCYWRVNWIGTGHRRLFCRKDNWPDPQNHPPYDLWREPPPIGPGLPEAKFLGEQYETGYNYQHEPPDVVYKQNHWIFSGTGLQNGQQFGFGYVDATGRHGIVAGEIDNTITGRADFPIDTLAQRKVWSVVASGYDSLWHQMIYYEDTTSNARVFAQGASGWWTGLSDNADHPEDVAKMRIITINIFEHFSGRRFLGNIYANITWDYTQLGVYNVELDGDTYVKAARTLTIGSNMTLTINSGVTLYVQGTLIIGSNVTITGGGGIVTQGSGVIKVTNSAEALAFNNSRKLARDGSGNYHVVFESDGEICYEKLNSSGALVAFRRLSAGNGSNKYPAIAERGGRLYVAWQRYDAELVKYAVHFRKSTDSGASWGSVTTPASNISASSPLLPAISSPATDKLTLIYRTGSNLGSRISANDGSSWTSGTVPSTNSSDNSPSLAWSDTYYLNFARWLPLVKARRPATHNSARSGMFIEAVRCNGPQLRRSDM